ncbi:MAG: peptidoglycan DD-metalloendopeptidase family protein, partial [Candidatus Hydrogenedentota bacterium]
MIGKSRYYHTTERNFWDIEASGITKSDAGTGLPTDAMRQRSTFTAKDVEWDFDEVWAIEDGMTYPYLIGVEPPETLKPDFELTFPLPSGAWRLTQGFGKGHDGLRGHLGVDYAAEIGTPVYAAADGEVVLVQEDDGGDWGNAVIVRHEWPDDTVRHTQYAHLDSIAPHIVEGAMVSVGSRLGTVGKTGKGTGAHLHFEIKEFESGVAPVLPPGYSGEDFDADEITIEVDGAGEVRYLDPEQVFAEDREETGEAVVAGTGGAGLRLRGEPGLQSERLTVMPYGGAVALLEGSHVADGYTWQEVEYQGQQGWAARRYLSVQDAETDVFPAPVELEQLTADGEAVSEGGEIAGNSVTLGASLPEGVTDDEYLIEFELRPADASFSTPTRHAVVPEGETEGSVSVGALGEGAYRWRARVADRRGRSGAWEEFGAVDETAFEIVRAVELNAGFDSEPGIITEGEPVTFEPRAEDTDDLSFHWDFGDGNTSEEESPSHTFAEPGEYEVALQVEDGAGNQANHAQELRVASADLVEVIDDLVDEAEKTMDNTYGRAGELAETADYFHASIDFTETQVVHDLVWRMMGSNVVLEEISYDLLRQVHEEEHGETYSDVFLPTLEDFISAKKSELAEARDDAVEAAAHLSPEEAQELRASLQKRWTGLVFLDREYYERTNLPIEFAGLKQDDEDSWTWLGARISFGIGMGAGTWATGMAGGALATIAAPGITIGGAVDSYRGMLSGLDINQQFLFMSTGGLMQATTHVDIAAETVNAALQEVADANPSPLPEGQILSICHHPEGNEFYVGHDEHFYTEEAHSEILIRNTGDTAATYRLVTSYQTEFTTVELAGSLPGGRREYFVRRASVEEDIHLEPGDGETVKVAYMGEGGGELPEGHITFTLTAQTDNGFYGLDDKPEEFGAHCWFADSAEASGAAFGLEAEHSAAQDGGEVVPAEEEDDAELVNAPLQSSLVAHRSGEGHKLYLHVRNPHDFALLMELEQALPSDAVVTDADGGSSGGTELDWEFTLQPEEARLYTVEFDSDALAEGEELADATLLLHDPINEDEVTFFRGSSTVELITVPDVVEALQEDAETAIEEADLSVGDVETAHDPGVPEGHVISQHPEAEQNVEVGSSVDLTVSLGPAPGTLEVMLTPDEAVDAGAQWRVADGDWLDSGENVELDPGEHEVTFREVDGFVTPEAQTVVVESDATAEESAAYVETGALQGVVEPGEAVDAGAQWRIDGGEWQESGVVLEDLAPGEYDVVFDDVESWVTPEAREVTVEEGETADTVGQYELVTYALEYAAGPNGSVQGDLSQTVEHGAD